MFAAPMRWRIFQLVPYACLAVAVGASQIKQASAPSEQPRPSLASGMDITQFLLVNEYVLFRQMTETRPEILIEASGDGTDWKAYEFRWKPGDPARPPRFCTPHQPRLDWQMWFEALRLEQVHQATGTIAPRHMSPWFQSFLLQLLKGEPQVVGLLEPNSVPDAPPKFIRVALYQYRFTDTAEGRATGDWWHRDPVWVGPDWSLSQ